MKSVLNAIIAPAFYPVHCDIKRHGHTFYWLCGGRGSTKSSFVSVEIPLLLLRHPEMHAVVLRKIGNTVKDSVYSQIQWGIDQLGLTDAFAYRKSPYEITYRRTGQKIYFFGVDDPHKIKSLKPPHGYVGVVWFEELDQFSGMEEVRNINQSLMRGGNVFYEFFTYNPPKSQDNWVNVESLADDADRMTSHTTYLDVPRTWLGEPFFFEAEKLKARNEMLYRHEYLGEVTGTGGAVFENVHETAFTDAQVDAFDHRYYGLDFGFAVDPMAFIVMHYDAKHETLYIFGEVYEQKLTNKRGAEKIKALLPNATAQIVADSAEPKSIAEMKDYGLRVTGARKGPDSVEYGIRWLQSLAAIHIDRHRAPNTYREFISYEYEHNREGQFISAYPDKDNHAIDAVRYACEPLTRRKNFRF